MNRFGKFCGKFEKQLPTQLFYGHGTATLLGKIDFDTNDDDKLFGVHVLGVSNSNNENRKSKTKNTCVLFDVGCWPHYATHFDYRVCAILSKR